MAIKVDPQKLFRALDFIGVELPSSAIFDIGEAYGMTHDEIRTCLWTWHGSGHGEFTNGWKFRVFPQK